MRQAQSFLRHKESGDNVNLREEVEMDDYAHRTLPVNVGSVSDKDLCRWTRMNSWRTKIAHEWSSSTKLARYSHTLYRIITFSDGELGLRDLRKCRVTVGLSIKCCHSYRGKQSSRKASERRQYLIMRWMFPLMIGCLTGLCAFIINLCVENIAGYKFQV